MIDAVSGGGAPFLATGNGSGDSGFGGGSAIWAIVLVALLGFGRNGGGGCGGGCEATDAVNNAELNDRIDNINAMAEQRATYKETCETHLAVANLGREGVENKYDLSLQLKDMQMANAECCCSTNLNIERTACATNAAIHAEGEATRALITADKIEALRDKLNEYQLRESQCNQNATLINALRPFPQPSWNVNNPYAAQGIGCGCGAYSF